jgi:hypothetical protein
MDQLRIEVINRAYAAIPAAKTPAERAWMIEDCNRTAQLGYLEIWRQIVARVDAPDPRRVQKFAKSVSRNSGNAAVSNCRRGLRSPRMLISDRRTEPPPRTPTSSAAEFVIHTHALKAPTCGPRSANASRPSDRQSNVQFEIFASVRERPANPRFEAGLIVRDISASR